MKKTLLVCFGFAIAGLVCIGLSFAMVSNRINWQQALTTNSAIGPNHADEQVKIESGYKAILTTGGTCQRIIEEEAYSTSSPTSWLGGPTARSSSRPKQSDLSNIYRDGETWTWTATAKGDNNPAVYVQCDTPFILVDYPRENSGHYILRVIIQVVGGLLLVFGVFMFIGRLRKVKSSTNQTNSASSPPTPLAPGKSYMANYSVGSLARGGRLNLTGDSVAFEPSDFERGVTDTQAVAIAYKDIARVDIAPRTWGLTDGGMRKRLRITDHNNKEYLFVINNVAEIVKIIQEAADRK